MRKNTWKKGCDAEDTPMAFQGSRVNFEDENSIRRGGCITKLFWR